VRGADARIIDNTAAANSDVGIYSEGGATQVRRNRVFLHSDGIGISDDPDVTITGNVALGNNPDLVDDHPQCADHTWKENIFSLGNPPCTD
jgi:hypothetical protein